MSFTKNLKVITMLSFEGCKRLLLRFGYNYENYYTLKCKDSPVNQKCNLYHIDPSKPEEELQEFISFMKSLLRKTFDY
jgi:hypothetical protein